MLLGRYEHTIDDKSRLTLPVKFRGAFAEGIVVTAGMDGCLAAYSPEGWQNLVSGQLASLHPLVALRYSATHRDPYNRVYRVTPFDAYRQGLAKGWDAVPYVNLIAARIDSPVKELVILFGANGVLERWSLQTYRMRGDAPAAAKAD